MAIRNAVIESKPVEALRSRFRGALPRPDEEGYDVHPDGVMAGAPESR